LGKKFKDENIPFEMIVGFNNKDKVAYEQEMKQLCPNLIICTDDGSYGEKGNVVEIIKKHHFENLYYFVCGAPGLIKAVYKNCQRGQISLDARMGCGFGACMGCSIKTKNG
jgi:dihydroorotate dehydrogenase electron transfer subunit